MNDNDETKTDNEEEKPNKPSINFLPVKITSNEVEPSESELSAKKKPKIAIALGSGSARGLAHIGVLNALKEAGIEADIVCGSSIGAVVGAAYAHDRLNNLEEWVKGLNRWKLVRFLNPTFSRGSFVDAEKIRNELSEVVADHDINIEDLQKPFTAVATDMLNGNEIRFSQGSLHQAILASTAIPGLMPPVPYKGRWIIDGGVVNPVPVNVCRNFEPDLVFAVNLNDNLLKASINKSDALPEHTNEPINASPPGLFDSFANAINVMQDRVTKSRMVGDPPDVLLTPRVSGIGMMEFDRAEETIEEGKRAVERQLNEISHIIDNIII